MVLKSAIAALLLLGVIRADTNAQDKIEVCEASNASNLASLANEQMSQRPGCVCPSGQTLVNPRHSSFLPPYCSTILRSDAVQCKLGWAGVCISDSIEQRAACQFPEVLEMSCAGYGHDSQLIFHEGQFRCLLTGKTPKQCGDVCPSGFSPRCIQLRCLKAFQPEPIEVIVEVPVTVTKGANSTATITATTTTTTSAGTVTTTVASGTLTSTITSTITSGTVTTTITSTITTTKTTHRTCTCHKNPCECQNRCSQCNMNPCQCSFNCGSCGQNPCQCNNNNGPTQPNSNAPFKADRHQQIHANDSEYRRGGISRREGKNRTPSVGGQCLPWPVNRILGY